MADIYTNTIASSRLVGELSTPMGPLVMGS